ncbi:MULTISPECIES: beta strand repeat-containing protein [unclassified Nocardioides]|uniref:beta strand repeat-containing protein n=1 Tax=unclassified Nocardioides TaxID=2615069 RepID=UPI000A270107|nr:MULTISPECIES: Ig-like domain-containing protein [unclassified Nocardioides]
MISSGIKRGLAATAVSALAIAGVPLLATSASAVSLNSSVTDANTLELATPTGTTVSAQNDGTDSTVRLEAIGGANISTVRFSYSLNGTDFNTIATVSRNDNGAFSTEWNPAGLAGATGLTIRATGLAADGTTVVDTVDNNPVAVDNNADTVNITDGTGVGVFQQQYAGHTEQDVIVKGTASDPASAPALAFWDPSAHAFAPGGTATSTTADGATTGTWTGVMDITGYDYGTGDELLVRATDVTQDAEAFGLYKQTITTVTATADRTNVPAGSSANVTVTVVDQNGQPIAGAEVRSSNGGGAQYTDAMGQAPFAQNAGSAYYYANTDDSDPFEPELGDKKSDTVTVTQYSAAPTSLAATSRDGAAFDVEENDSDGVGTDDITVQIKDQQGNNVAAAGRTVRYYWTETPFDGSPATERFPASPVTSTTVTDGTGKANIAFPTGQTDIDGTYVLHASLDADPLGNGAVAEAEVLTVKAGESDLMWENGDPTQAVIGSSVDATGSLELADGTGLPGRSVKVDYANGGGNAGIVLANGTTAATRTVTTGADGSFTVTVKDAATPNTPESGTLTANTVAGTTDSDDPNEGPATLDVDFLADVTPATVTVAPGATTDLNGSANDAPGELKPFTITVKTADDPATPGDESHAVSNATVNLTLDHGFFTDGTTNLPTVAGADAPDYKVLGTDGGKSLTVTTNGSGQVTVLTSIGRDAGFDDDGMVTSTVTATVASLSKTATHDWDSSDPINGGEVKLVESPADRQSGPTDPSPITNDVRYDVFTTDQFGNLVGGETVALSVDDPDASVSSATAVSDFDDRGEFDVSATRGGTYTVTGTWATETLKYTNTAGATAAGTETVAGSTDAEFYSVDFTASTFTITSNPEGRVPVGSAVTETVTAIDQEGNPIPGLSVRFAVAGPGDQTSDVERFTNANGQAFYTVIGNSKGTANVNAVITDGEQVQTVSDTVVFGAKKKFIGMQLRNNSRGNTDILKVNAKPIAEGLVAKVFVDGKKVAQHKLGSAGNHNFKIKDKNGNQITTYLVKVAETATTHAAQNQEKIK